MMSIDRERELDLDRVAGNWLVRVQMGDTSGPGENADGHAEAIAAFEAWRAADPAHAAAYERVRRSIDQTDYLPMGRLVGTSRLSRVSFRRRHSIVMLACAASLIGVASMGLYRSFGPGQGMGLQTSAVGVDNVYLTMIGETRKISLPDGSTVLLDADSQLRVQYNRHTRNLWLDRGRARFTVAHDLDRAFAVNAGDGRVIAHGTIFDVAVGAHGVHVALLRGSIEVARKRGRAGGGSSRQLVPGQQLSFAPAAPLPIPQAMPLGELEWVSGRLTFSDARLGEAVDEINRYNNLKIVLSDPALGDLRVSGGFEARRPEAFAQAVARALGLKLVRQSDGRLLIVSGLPPVG